MLTLNGGPRRTYVQLMRNLMLSGTKYHGPNIRIGGNSADESAYIPEGVVVSGYHHSHAHPDLPLPKAYKFRITDANISTYKQVVPLWNGTVVIDTTLRNATDPALAVAHLNAIERILGWDTRTALGDLFVESVEIGNEPGLFDDEKLHYRPKPWTSQEYWSEFDMYQEALVNSGFPQRRTQCCVFTSKKFADSINTELKPRSKNVRARSCLIYHGAMISDGLVGVSLAQFPSVPAWSRTGSE